MLNIAIQAARQASKVILRYVDQMDKVQVSEKSENDFVTQVDQQSEAIIINEIRKSYPNHPMLAEESGDIPGKQTDFCWIIDPLDGTRNFKHGFSHFCISIALMIRNQPEIGVVYDPIRQDLFTATRGQGAYLNSRRIRVSQTKKLQSALIGTGFPILKSDATTYFQQFETVFMQCADIRRTGSAALDLAYVAAGKLDGFWQSGLQIWDIAAGALMIKEAGGAITDFHDGDTYLHQGQVLAGNLKIHKALICLSEQCSAAQRFIAQ